MSDAQKAFFGHPFSPPMDRSRTDDRNVHVDRDFAHGIRREFASRYFNLMMSEGLKSKNLDDFELGVLIPSTSVNNGKRRNIKVDDSNKDRGRKFLVLTVVTRLSPIARKDCPRCRYRMLFLVRFA